MELLNTGGLTAQQFKAARDQLLDDGAQPIRCSPRSA